MRVSFWPAIVVTLLSGLCFSGLKFVLIGELAVPFDGVSALPKMWFEWMDVVLSRANEKGAVREAISQGMAAVLTIGVLIGYLMNAPLAGAWRASRLFLLASLGVALSCLATNWVSPWPVAIIIGITYGTACAARGKVVPLYAQALHKSNTLISGLMNATLVIGLLVGVVFGGEIFARISDPLHRRLVIFGILMAAAILSQFINPPDKQIIPFRTGLNSLLSTSRMMIRRYWALLISGGLAWGIASAASLAGMIYAVDELTPKLQFNEAARLVVFPAIGAIIGNLISHWLDRRRYVIGAFVGLAISLAVFPLLVKDVLSAGIVMTTIGILFAAPTNVLDAKLLANAAAEGDPGRGSTSMSLWHNVFILVITMGLALPLFLGLMTPAGQFYFLAGATLVTALITGFTSISAGGGTVIDAAPVSEKFSSK